MMSDDDSGLILPGDFYDGDDQDPLDPDPDPDAEIARLEQEVRALRETVARLKKEFCGYQAHERDVNEALNSGDGSYHP